jgi:hypothetical protein
MLFGDTIDTYSEDNYSSEESEDIDDDDEDDDNDQNSEGEEDVENEVPINKMSREEIMRDANVILNSHRNNMVNNDPVATATTEKKKKAVVDLLISSDDEDDIKNNTGKTTSISKPQKFNWRLENIKCLAELILLEHPANRLLSKKVKREKRIGDVTSSLISELSDIPSFRYKTGIATAPSSPYALTPSVLKSKYQIIMQESVRKFRNI